MSIPIQQPSDLELNDTDVLDTLETQSTSTTESDETYNIRKRIKRTKQTNKQLKHTTDTQWKHFTDTEMYALLQGVQQYGTHWTQILKDEKLSRVLYKRDARSLEKRYRYHMQHNNRLTHKVPAITSLTTPTTTPKRNLRSTKHRTKSYNTNTSTQYASNYIKNNNETEMCFKALAGVVRRVSPLSLQTDESYYNDVTDSDNTISHKIQRISIEPTDTVYDVEELKQSDLSPAEQFKEQYQRNKRRNKHFTFSAEHILQSQQGILSHSNRRYMFDYNANAQDTCDIPSVLSSPDNNKVFGPVSPDTPCTPIHTNKRKQQQYSHSAPTSIMHTPVMRPYLGYQNMIDTNSNIVYTPVYYQQLSPYYSSPRTPVYNAVPIQAIPINVLPATVRTDLATHNVNINDTTSDQVIQRAPIPIPPATVFPLQQPIVQRSLTQ